MARLEIDISNTAVHEVLCEIEKAVGDPASLPRYILDRATALQQGPASDLVNVRAHGGGLIAEPAEPLLALLANIRAHRAVQS